jgi:hypothetical protein
MELGVRLPVYALILTKRHGFYRGCGRPLPGVLTRGKGFRVKIVGC